jgi:hypothetical protein
MFFARASLLSLPMSKKIQWEDRQIARLDVTFCCHKTINWRIEDSHGKEQKSKSRYLLSFLHNCLDDTYFLGIR